MTKNGKEIQNHLQLLEKEFFPKSDKKYVNPKFGK